MESALVNFFQTLIQMETVFWFTEIVFLNKPSILAIGNGFWLLQTFCFYSERLAACGYHSWS